MSEDFIQSEGRNLNIAWDKFVPHSSIFVPSQNTKECKKLLKRACNKRKFRTRVRVGTWDGVLGVRVWRLEDKKG